MSEIEFLPFESAVHLVGAIQEEEHTRELNKRIFTVYDKQNRELCWFDAEELIAEIDPDNPNPQKDKIQAEVEKFILNHIPAWVLDND